MFIIRNFKEKDLSTVVRLSKKMIDYHHEIDPYYKPSVKYENLKDDAREWLIERNTKVLVAEIDGGIVGYARGSIERSPMFVTPSKIGIVDDLFVAEPYRKQGIGERLFSGLLDWFKIKKVKNIELSVDFRNEAGIKFWEKLGFFKYKLKMRLVLT